MGGINAAVPGRVCGSPNRSYQNMSYVCANEPLERERLSMEEIKDTSIQVSLL